MSAMQALLNTYDQYHTHPTNRLLHRLGVPMVLLSIIMLLTWINITFGLHAGVHFSWIAAAAVSGYYLQLDLKSNLAPSFCLIVLTLFTGWLIDPQPGTASAAVCASLFGLGWCLLLVGHVIEKKKPAFAENLTHLLIGPLYLYKELTGFIKSRRHSVITHSLDISDQETSTS